MKNTQITVIKVFCLSQTSRNLEWAPLLSHKYKDALDFNLELSSNLEDSQIIVWDGLITPKSEEIFNRVIKKLKSPDATLFYSGEERTLFSDHPYTKRYDLKDTRLEILPARPLPEEILFALDTFWKKRANV